MATTTLPPYVAVEGNSGVGKSVTASALAEWLAPGQYFPEYFGYLDAQGGESLPAFPPSTFEEVAYSNRLWPVLDMRRQQHRQLVTSAETRFQVLDTTPLSVIGYELAKARLGIFSDIEDLASRYVDLYDAALLQQPGGWVFLSSPAEVILSRIAHRGGSRDLLKRVDTIKYLDSVRRFFSTHFLDATTFVWIDNSTCSLECVIAEAIPFIEQLSGITQTSGLQAFFHEMKENPKLRGELLCVEKSDP